MKKAVIRSVILVIAAMFVLAVGTLFCLSIAGHDNASAPEGWNITLMMPENAAIVTAVIMIVLAASSALLAAVLLISVIKIELTARTEKKENRKTRFTRLASIDRQETEKGKENGRSSKTRPGAPETPFNITLEEFTEGFRNFAAGQLGLFYDRSVIRTYVAAMAASRLTILQGISGTGKTSLPYAFGKYVNNHAVVMPVQPSWKDRSDLLGYYNEFTDSYTETEMLTQLYRANYDGKIYVIVLDEMNIARVEYYFAEFLSLLELPDRTSRRIRVTSDSRPSDPELFEGGTLLLPDNVWFAGTANNDDSTLAISDKVYDRAFVIDLNSRANPFPAASSGPSSITAAELQVLFEKAVADYPLSEQLRDRLLAADKYLSERVGFSFGNRTMRQLEKFVPVYIAAGGDEDQAADTVICHKILRKMEGLNPVICRREAEGIRIELRTLFGPGKLPECEAYLDRIISGER